MSFNKKGSRYKSVFSIQEERSQPLCGFPSQHTAHWKSAKKTRKKVHDDSSRKKLMILQAVGKPGTDWYLSAGSVLMHRLSVPQVWK